MDRDSLEIRTADNVPVGFDTAGIGSRLSAFLIDGLLIGLVDVAADILLLNLVGSAGLAVLLIAAGVPFLLIVAYFVLAETVSGGRTPGKRALGLRVVRLDGSAPGFEEALVRGVVRILDILLGWIPMFFHPQSRRLGDLAAGTAVVRERRRQPAAPTWTPPPPGAGATAATAELAGDAGGRLGSAEYTAIRALFSRAELAPEQRRRIASTLAARLCDRLELPLSAPERRLPPEEFLAIVYRQLDPRFGA